MSFGQRQQAWATGSGANQQINAGLFPNQLTGLVNAAQPFANLSSLAPGLNALVNQAAFTNMNQVLAQAQRAQQLLPQAAVAAATQQRQASPPPSAGRTQRNFIGTVTKLMETYGFVDEDVFFQTSVIRGTVPRVGDRVAVEASYNPSMPFKWNAYSLRLMQQESPQNLIQAQQQSVYRSTSSAVGNTVGSGGGGTRWGSGGGGDRHRTETTSSSDRHRQSSRRSPPSTRRTSPPSRSQRTPPPSSRRSRTPERSRRSPMPSKRERDRSRERSPIVRERERDRSPARRESRNRSPSVVAVTQVAARRESISPPRRRQRIIPRYQCSLPKPLIASAEMKYTDIHKRYPQLYVPSDFTRCEMSWLKSFTMEEPITLSPHPITFHVMHKDVDFPLGESEGQTAEEQGDAVPSLENPLDADSRYIVKVLLLSHQGGAAIRQKVFGLLPDGSIDENVETQSLFKNLFFLHGLRGRNESMCIGGAWSPSLDGESPTDPQTLIKTAVRTTLASTGVDLSACSKWYKIAQLSYYRAERGRVHTVTLMLPDLSASSLSLMPSAEVYAQTEERVKAQLAAKVAAIDSEEFVPPTRNVAAAAATVPASTNNESSGEPGAPPSSTLGGNGDVQAAGDVPPPQQTIVANSEQTQPAAQVVESAPKPKGKTHWSQLNIKAMKVAELREELEVRGIDSKGVKNALVQRLQEAVDKEKVDEEPNVVVAEEPKEASAPIVTDREIKEEKMDTDELEIIGEVKNAAIPPAEELVERKDEEVVALEAKPKKSEKELKELERAKEKFEKEKKERKAALERHYTMPKEPCVLVFPSKTAKGGKFECRVSSLATLLDYRPDDNKESSFEVFLFSEAVKEALDRCHAFTVFKAVATALDKEEERKRRDAALLEAPAVKENGVEDTVGKAVESAESGGAGGEDKKASGKEKDEKKKEVDPRTLYKSLVGNVDLFSSFAYFDQNVCGHIDERDFEEILYSLRFDISRADVQRLAKKLSSRDRINYRNLTDKWVDKEGNVKYCHPGHDAQSPVDPAFAHYELASNDEGRQSVAGAPQAILGQTPDVTETGVVFYRGTVLNITHTMEQQKAMERERDASLLKSQELQFTLKSTKEQRDYLEKKRRRLEEDVERYKKKLHDAEKSLKTSQENAGEMKIALQSCKRFGERLVEVVDKIMPPPKKEKSEKVKKEDKAEVRVTAAPPAATGGHETTPAEGVHAAEETTSADATASNDQNDAVMEGEFVLAEEVGEGTEEADKSTEEPTEQDQIE